MLKSQLQNMIVLGGEAFGKCLSHEGGTLMSGISTFIKKLERVEAREGGRFGWGGEKRQTTVIEQQ